MGRKNNKVVNCLLFCLLFIAACKKDKPDDIVKPPISDSTDKVYIVCEGSLGSGNSSLDVYDLETATVHNDVYNAANNKMLGDIFQSMVRIGDRYFLSVNNSDKIVVLNSSDHKEVGTIAVKQPRYILPLSADKAYVSTLYSNKIYILNTSSLQVTGSIDLPAMNAEEMLLNNGKVYACGWDTASDKVFVINPATDAIEKNIAVAGRAPQSIVADNGGNLWVLGGNVEKGKKASLTQLSPNGDLLKSYIFPDKADAMKLLFDSKEQMLYFIEVNYKGETTNNGIYRMALTDAQLPDKPLIQAQKFQYFWGIGIDKQGDLYVADPKGFIQQGLVDVYDTKGNKKKTFNTGVGPGHFYFE